MKAVYGYTFLTGASTLLNVKESRSSKRRYVLKAPVRFCVDFDDGTLGVSDSRRQISRSSCSCGTSAATARPRPRPYG